MSEEWELFEAFGDRASATALVELLYSEGVPAVIEASSPVPGLDEVFRVAVPKRLAHRARWVTKTMATSDAELAFIATGELGGPESDEES